ncbi:MAG TPA: hypothetical protein VEH52_13405 [Gaiellaceae bacterium]|jgi:hypothetical protein|nr:hypothetical protein [Gaiellaceae bacterium]
MSFRFRWPSPAVVIASLALLVALSGTSIAAVTAVPKNSVGTPQLKNSAVTSAKLASNAVVAAKIAANAVGAAKIAANAVTSAKVQNHTLLADDFAPGQLQPGPRGPAGPPGTIGKLTLQSASVSIGKNNSTELTVSCKSGEQAVSGGATWSDKGDLLQTLVYSGPVYNTAAHMATGWSARGRNQTKTTRTFIVQVLCGTA